MKYVVTIRGILKDTDEEQAHMAHDATVQRVTQIGKPLGHIGHQTQLNMKNRREFLAIDTWDNWDGLQKFLSDPANPGEIVQLFEGEPDITIWVTSGWLGF